MPATCVSFRLQRIENSYNVLTNLHSVSPPEFTMDDYRESFASPRCPPPRPPTKEKSWIPFKKLGLLRLKQSKAKPVTTSVVRPANMDVVKRNVKGRNHGKVAEGDDFLELFATGRDTVLESGHTTQTPTPTRARMFTLSTPNLHNMKHIAVPDTVVEADDDNSDSDCPTDSRCRLSREISTYLMAKRPQTRPTPTRANAFSLSTPDLLSMRHSTVTGTECEHTGAGSRGDYTLSDAPDPFEFDSVLSNIMAMFPIPPGGLDDDPDRTIRPKKPGCSRTRVDSLASFSTATSSVHESVNSGSGCSQSTGVTSPSRQSLDAYSSSKVDPPPTRASVALRNAHVPVQANHRITFSTQSIMRSADAPNFTCSTSAFSSTSPPTLLESPEQHTSQPPSQPHYSDSNPPPVPPKDRVFIAPISSDRGNAAPRLALNSTNAIADPVHVFALGCGMMGEKTSASGQVTNDGSDSEVDKTTLKPRSKTSTVPQGLFLNRKVNHDRKVLHKASAASTSSAVQWLPPFNDV